MMISALPVSPVLGLSKEGVFSLPLFSGMERDSSVCVSIAPHCVQVKVLMPSESIVGSVVILPSSQLCFSVMVSPQSQVL